MLKLAMTNQNNKLQFWSSIKNKISSRATVICSVWEAVRFSVCPAHSTPPFVLPLVPPSPSNHRSVFFIVSENLLAGLSYWLLRVKSQFEKAQIHTITIAGWYGIFSRDHFAEEWWWSLWLYDYGWSIFSLLRLVTHTAPWLHRPATY